MQQRNRRRRLTQAQERQLLEAGLHFGPAADETKAFLKYLYEGLSGKIEFRVIAADTKQVVIRRFFDDATAAAEWVSKGPHRLPPQQHLQRSSNTPGCHERP